MFNLSFSINQKTVSLECQPMDRLIDVLRLNLGLTGTKEGCGEGECGACSVWVDGELVNSCLIPAAQVQGRKVVTIEGIEKDGRLDLIQKSFLEFGGAQCGICTPGMIMASAHLLNENPTPSREEVCQGLAGNLCRCTGYTKIIDSVQKAIGGQNK